MKVVCCTYYSPSYKALADISLPNLSEYCAKHGYYMWVENIENDKWEYVKHDIFKKLFEEGFDLIWYKDVDSIITNMTIPITNFIDDSHDFFITKDFNELNGGSVIIKNTEGGRWVNNMVLANRSKYENEQNVYNANMDMMLIGGFIKILPQQTINAYQYELYPECKSYVGREDLGDWVEGKSFVLHTPGLGIEKRIEVLKNANITR